MDSVLNVSSIISPSILNKYVEFWISEDIPNFDLSTMIVSSDFINANIEMKEIGILAGLPFAEAVLKYFDCNVEWKYKEGHLVDKPTVIGLIHGQANKVLMAERTVLNILSRSCGVATVAQRVLMKLKPKWSGELAGNRKTTPGFRIVEKYAMYIGGISTHRYDLSAMAMIKDNHIKSNGSIEKSVTMLRSKIGKLNNIEIECSTLEEAVAAAKAGADIIMLDNFDSNDVRSVSKQVKNINPSVLIEASGGIHENNITEYAIDSVDIISSSLFNQGYKCIDISIKVVCVNTKPDISESLNVINSQPKNEIIGAVKSCETDSSSVVPKTDAIEKEKVATKRKLEEPTNAIADKPNTIINKVAESPTDKLNSAPKQPIKPNQVNKTPKFEAPANKQRKTNANTNGKVGQAIYNLQPVGSVRMPGTPVRFDAKNQNSSRANMDNQANFIRTMAANLVLQLQNSQPNNHPPFMSPTAMRFGGPIPRVPFMNKFFCKSCNFQNPNGNPFCQLCRKKLE